MIARTMARGLGLGLLLALTPIASATACTDATMKAYQVRLLQTEIMVAALHCGRGDVYNRFVQAHRDGLIEHGETLRSHYATLHGRDGAERLGEKVTALANDAAHRISSLGLGACAATEALLEVAATLPTTGLDSYAAAWVVRRGHAPLSCAPETLQAQR